jgi:hypothetical protein
MNPSPTSNSCCVPASLKHVLEVVQEPLRTFPFSAYPKQLNLPVFPAEPLITPTARLLTGPSTSTYHMQMKVFINPHYLFGKMR